MSIEVQYVNSNVDCNICFQDIPRGHIKIMQ